MDSPTLDTLARTAARVARCGRPVGIVLLAFATLALTASVSAAQGSGERRSALERLEEGDAIRRRLLLRGGRFEATPLVGFTLNDPFRRNVLFGGRLAYHITDSIAVGATAFAGVAMDTALAEDVGTKRPELAEAGEFADVGFIGSLDFIYTPVIGKFALFGRWVFNYDLHVLAGIGGTKISGDASVDDFSLAPVLGFGARTFFSEWMAIDVQVRDYIFSSALNSVADVNTGEKPKADNEISNNFVVTFGVAFFFPTEPALSN